MLDIIIKDKPSAYLETSVISNLTSRPSIHTITLAMQQITRHWWKHERQNFRLVISTLVGEEISRGDPAAIAKRRQAVGGIEVLEINQQIRNLAKMLLKKHLLPEKAGDDAVHIATATFYGIDYLLSYNCKHIANDRIFPKIRDTIEEAGYRCPTITTPQFLNSISEEL